MQVQISIQNLGSSHAFRGSPVVEKSRGQYAHRRFVRDTIIHPDAATVILRFPDALGLVIEDRHVALVRDLTIYLVIVEAPSRKKTTVAEHIDFTLPVVER